MEKFPQEDSAPEAESSIKKAAKNTFRAAIIGVGGLFAGNALADTPPENTPTEVTAPDTVEHLLQNATDTSLDEIAQEDEVSEVEENLKRHFPFGASGDTPENTVQDTIDRMADETLDEIAKADEEDTFEEIQGENKP